MIKTAKLQLNKPEGTDVVNIEDLNANMDILDNEVTKLATQASDGRQSAADKKKLDGIAAGANNYVHPSTHPASMISQDANNRFVTDAEKANWNSKETTTGAQSKANTAESNAKTYSDQKLATHQEDNAAHTAFTTCATAASTTAKTAALAGFSLATGSRVTVKFTYANTASAPTLNINGTGAKAIYLNGTQVGNGGWEANAVLELVYDGTRYNVINDAGIGKLSNLATTAKTNLVNAINEVFTDVSDLKTKVKNAVTDKGGTVLDADGDGVPTADELVAGVASIKQVDPTETYSTRNAIFDSTNLVKLGLDIINSRNQLIVDDEENFYFLYGSAIEKYTPTSKTRLAVNNAYGYLRELVFDDDSKKIYVGSNNKDLVVLNKSLVIQKVIPLDGNVQACVPIGNNQLVVASESQRIYLVDTKTDTVIRNELVLGIGGYHRVLKPDPMNPKQIFFATSSGAVGIINIETMTLIQTANTNYMSEATGMVFTSPTQLIVGLLGYANSNVYVYDRTTNSFVDAKQYGSVISLDGDGILTYISDDSASITKTIVFGQPLPNNDLSNRFIQLTGKVAKRGTIVKNNKIYFLTNAAFHVYRHGIKGVS